VEASLRRWRRSLHMRTEGLRRKVSRAFLETRPQVCFRRRVQRFPLGLWVAGFMVLPVPLALWVVQESREAL
jgi:hypothetical protein